MSDSAPEPRLQLLMSTVPDAATGERIAAALVDEGLAACVQLLPGLVSHYRWRGEHGRGEELLLLAKTVRGADCLARLAALHPYDVPEGLLIDAAATLPAYLRWALDASAN